MFIFQEKNKNEKLQIRASIHEKVLGPIVEKNAYFVLWNLYFNVQFNFTQCDNHFSWDTFSAYKRTKTKLINIIYTYSIVRWKGSEGVVIRCYLSCFVYSWVAFCFYKIFLQFFQDKPMGAVSILMTVNYPRQPVDDDGPLPPIGEYGNYAPEIKWQNKMYAPDNV